MHKRAPYLTALLACFPLAVHSIPQLDISGHQGLLIKKEPSNNTPHTSKETLQTHPSLFLKQYGGVGQMTTLSFRGLSSRHTLLKIDDIPIRDALGCTDLSPFLGGSLQIEEAEAGSTGILNGSGGVGGVIEMKTPFLKPHQNQTSAWAGSNDTGYFHTAHNKTHKGTALVFHAEGLSTKGISQRGELRKYGEKAHVQKGTLAAGLRHQSGSHTSQLTARQINKKNKYDLFGPFSAKPQGTLTETHSIIGGHITCDGPKSQQKLQGFLTEKKLKSSNTSRSTLLNYGTNYHLHHHMSQKNSGLFLLGGDVDHLERGAFKKDYVFKLYIGGELHHHINKSFSLYGGLRFNRHQTFGNTITYGIGTKWVGTNKTLDLRYRTGFLNPSLYNLHVNDTYAVSNPKLKPEESRTLDGTYTHKINQKLVASIRPFWTELKKMIQGISIHSNRYQNQNISGSSRVSGAETVLKYSPSDEWTHQANYAYTNLDISRAGLDKEYPKHKASFMSTYKCSDATSFNTQVNYVGQRRNMNHKLHAHTLFNLSIDHMIKGNATLYGRIDNLFDVRYEEIYNFQTPGRSIYAGIQIRY